MSKGRRTGTETRRRGWSGSSQGRVGRRSTVERVPGRSSLHLLRKDIQRLKVNFGLRTPVIHFS